MDQVCELFGGLDMCGISALRGRDNKDYIIEVNDCCLPLIGDKQEEDKRAIADLVLTKMDSMAKSASGIVPQPTPATTVGTAATTAAGGAASTGTPLASLPNDTRWVR